MGRDRWDGRDTDSENLANFPALPVSTGMSCQPAACPKPAGVVEEMFYLRDQPPPDWPYMAEVSPPGLSWNQGEST
jgi:hypothetical protein